MPTMQTCRRRCRPAASVPPHRRHARIPPQQGCLSRGARSGDGCLEAIQVVAQTEPDRTRLISTRATMGIGFNRGTSSSRPLAASRSSPRSDVPRPKSGNRVATLHRHGVDVASLKPFTSRTRKRRRPSSRRAMDVGTSEALISSAWSWHSLFGAKQQPSASLLESDEAKSASRSLRERQRRSPAPRRAPAE